MIYPKAFLIVFSGRCGSSYLVDKLSEHPNIDAQGEVLHNVGHMGYKNNSNGQKKFVGDFFEGFKKDSDSLSSISKGFKIQFADDERSQIENVDQLIDVLKQHKITYIYLYRENKVKQAVSKIRGDMLKKIYKNQVGIKRSNIYTEHVTKSPKLELGPTNVNPDELLMHLERLEKAQVGIREFLVKTRESYEELSYETLFSDKANILSWFCDLLKVEQYEFSDHDPIKKLTSDDLSEVIENYEDCVAYFSDTRFGKYFN